MSQTQLLAAFFLCYDVSLIDKQWSFSVSCSAHSPVDSGVLSVASDSLPAALPVPAQGNRELLMGFDVYGFVVFSAAVLSNFMEKCHSSASEGGCAGIFVQSKSVCAALLSWANWGLYLNNQTIRR